MTKMDIRGAVDAAVPTNIIAAKAAEVRANKVNWQSYLQCVLFVVSHGCHVLLPQALSWSCFDERNTGKILIN